MNFLKDNRPVLEHPDVDDEKKGKPHIVSCTRFENMKRCVACAKEGLCRYHLGEDERHTIRWETDYDPYTGRPVFDLCDYSDSDDGCHNWGDYCHHCGCQKCMGECQWHPEEICRQCEDNRHYCGDCLDYDVESESIQRSFPRKYRVDANFRRAFRGSGRRKRGNHTSMDWVPRKNRRGNQKLRLKLWAL